MFGSRKKTLKEARQALAEAKQKAPARCVSFHRAVDECTSDIDKALEAFFSPDADLTNDLERQARELAGLAGRLDDFVRETMEIENDAETLSQRVSKLEPTRLRQALEERCAGWMDELAAFGVNVERDRELYSQQETADGLPVLPDYRNKIRLLDQAVEQVKEAEELLAKLGKKASTAALEAALDPYCEQLVQHGPDPAAIEKLAQQIAPVRREADTPPPPPPQPPATLRELRQLLPEVRQWIRVLGVGGDAVQKLTVDIQLIEQSPESWATANLSPIRQALMAEAERLRGEARQRRETKVRELAEIGRHFMAACGSDAGLESRLAECRRARADDPGAYESWQQALLEARRYLEGVAQTRIDEVETYVRARTAELAGRTATLKGRNLSDATRPDVERIERRVAQLQRVQGRDASLEALRESSDLERTLTDLERRAQEELSAYELGKQSAIARLDALAQAAGKSSADVPLPAFPELSSEPLGVCLAALEAFVAELERAERAFIGTCAALDRSDREFALAAARLTGRNSVPADGAERPATQDPAEAADRRVRARQIRTDAEAALERASDELMKRVKGYRERLAAVTPGPEEEAQNAADLVEMIDTGAYHEEPDPLERVKGLKELAGRCDSFFWYLDREKSQTLDQLTTVRRRWRRLFEDDLRRYFPRHAERAGGLLQGIPKEIADCGAVRNQLDEAERILKCIEAQAPRIAAAELDQAVRKLTARLPHMDAKEQGRTQNLLKELEDAGDRFPSAHLRRRIADAACGRQSA